LARFNFPTLRSTPCFDTPSPPLLQARGPKGPLPGAKKEKVAKKSASKQPLKDTDGCAAAGTKKRKGGSAATETKAEAVAKKPKAAVVKAVKDSRETTDDPFDWTCRKCDQPGDLIVCEGGCFGSFCVAGDCLGLASVPDKFICGTCDDGNHPCFHCKKKGDAENQTVKCSAGSCGKHYHWDCATLLPLTKVAEDDSSFKCPLHTCSTCLKECTTATAVYCTECPVSYHANGCIPPGVRELAERRILCPKHIKSDKIKTGLNSDRCKICQRGGELLCCDGCPAAFHPECLEDDDIEKETEGDNAWHCSDCQAGHKCMVGDVVWNKFGAHRWWPARIAALDEVPDNVSRLKHGEGDFPIFFFGSHDWAWVNHSVIMPFDDRTPNPGELKKKPFVKGLEEAQEEYEKVKIMKAEASLKIKEKLPEFKKLSKNQFLIPKVKEFEEDLHCNCTVENGACGEEADCISSGLNIECTDKTCKCGDSCKNRRMQRRQWKKVTPGKTPHCGYGLMADEDIVEGELIIEYIGEVMNRSMMEERLTKCQKKGINTYYLMALSRDLFIDARTKASNARFINHSCEPNCQTVIWNVAGLPCAGIFALQDLPKGTELTYDYDFDYLDEAKCKCYCGYKHCSGFIGLKKKKADIAAAAASGGVTKARPSKSAFAFFCEDYKKQWAKGKKCKPETASPAAADAASVEERRLAKKEADKEDGKLYREKARSTWDAMGQEEQSPYAKDEALWKAARNNELKKVKKKAPKRVSKAVSQNAFWVTAPKKDAGGSSRRRASREEETTVERSPSEGSATTVGEPAAEAAPREALKEVVA